MTGKNKWTTGRRLFICWTRCRASTRCGEFIGCWNIRISGRKIKITVVSRSKEKEVIKIPVIEIKEDENRVESAQKLIVKVQESELPKPLQLV